MKFDLFKHLSRKKGGVSIPTTRPDPDSHGMDCFECDHAIPSKEFRSKRVCRCKASPARGRLVKRGEFCSHFDAGE